MREAFRRAEEERPGATHLELPEDIAEETVATGIQRQPVEIPRARPCRGHRRGHVEAAKRPLLLIGAGANRKLTSEMLQQFVDEAGIPL